MGAARDRESHTPDGDPGRLGLAKAIEALSSPVGVALLAFVLRQQQDLAERVTRLEVQQRPTVGGTPGSWADAVRRSAVGGTSTQGPTSPPVGTRTTNSTAGASRVIVGSSPTTTSASGPATSTAQADRSPAGRQSLSLMLREALPGRVTFGRPPHQGRSSAETNALLDRSLLVTVNGRGLRGLAHDLTNGAQDSIDTVYILSSDRSTEWELLLTFVDEAAATRKLVALRSSPSNRAAIHRASSVPTILNPVSARPASSLPVQGSLPVNRSGQAAVRSSTATGAMPTAGSAIASSAGTPTVSTTTMDAQPVRPATQPATTKKKRGRPPKVTTTGTPGTAGSSADVTAAAQPNAPSGATGGGHGNGADLRDALPVETDGAPNRHAAAGVGASAIIRTVPSLDVPTAATNPSSTTSVVVDLSQDLLQSLQGTANLPNVLAGLHSSTMQAVARRSSHGLLLSDLLAASGAHEDSEEDVPSQPMILPSAELLPIPLLRPQADSMLRPPDLNDLMQATSISTRSVDIVDSPHDGACLVHSVFGRIQPTAIPSVGQVICEDARLNTLQETAARFVSQNPTNALVTTAITTAKRAWPSLSAASRLLHPQETDANAIGKVTEADIVWYSRSLLMKQYWLTPDDLKVIATAAGITLKVAVYGYDGDDRNAVKLKRDCTVEVVCGTSSTSGAIADTATRAVTAAVLWDNGHYLRVEPVGRPAWPTAFLDALESVLPSSEAQISTVYKLVIMHRALLQAARRPVSEGWVRMLSESQRAGLRGTVQGPFREAQLDALTGIGFLNYGNILSRAIAAAIMPKFLHKHDVTGLRQFVALSGRNLSDPELARVVKTLVDAVTAMSSMASMDFPGAIRNAIAALDEQLDRMFVGRAAATNGLPIALAISYGGGDPVSQPATPDVDQDHGVSPTPL